MIFKISIFKANLFVKNLIDREQSSIGYFAPGSGSEGAALETVLEKRVNYKIEVIGSGGDGSICIEPKIIDFDIVKVNFNKTITATLQNLSSTSFYVELEIRPIHSNEKSDRKPFDVKMFNLLKKNFTLSFSEGVLAGNSKIDINITFHPTEIVELNAKLICIARERNLKTVPLGNAEGRNNPIQKCSLSIIGKGNYPLLKIVDLRNDSVSVSTLWEHFQINTINKGDISIFRIQSTTYKAHINFYSFFNIKS